MDTEVIYRERRRKYHWPEVQLNLWILVILAASATVLGIFAWFLTVQQQLLIGIPWFVFFFPAPPPLHSGFLSERLIYHATRLFTFAIVTASLSLLFLLLILILAGRRMLIPGVILLGSFILFVLWLTALIETAIQLYGPAGNLNGNCATYVTRQQFRGTSVETLAWLTQNNICNSWKAAFAFEIIAAVLYFYMLILAWQVQRDESN